jgi:ABC-2 type transport system ATP-binding protein
MIIETKALTKRFRSRIAVRDLDLAVPESGISAFLGPNGSGKTTTIRMLLGLARPTSGSASILDCSISDDAGLAAARRRIGYVGEDKRLYGYMTAGELLTFMRSIYPSWRDDRERRFCKKFSIPLDQKCKALSKGMRTKLAMVLALSRQLELLILDEPSEGLDPVATEQLLESIIEVAADGGSVFFSTHQLSDVERIADRMFIMHGGRLVLQSSMEDVRENYRRIHAAFPCRPPIEQMTIVGVSNVRVEAHVMSLIATQNVDTILERARSLGAISVQARSIGIRELFLECVKGES